MRKNGSGQSRPDTPGMLAACADLCYLALFPLWCDFSYTHITRAKWVGMLVLLIPTAVLVALAYFTGGRKLSPPKPRGATVTA